jgi:dihydroflavonol-4-reductase
VTRALVTGGSGFIGHHLVSALVASGNAVRILDIRPPKNLQPGAQYIEGTVLDPTAVAESLREIDVVYHLAALPGMWTPQRRDFHAVNVKGTQIVLSAARECGISRFLHCSTESVLFDRRNSEPVDSENVRTTLAEMPGDYTRSKWAAEQLALKAAESGFPVVIAIPTMPIGPDHNCTPPTAMLKYFIGRRTPFYLDFVLNLVDVRDVAAGMILALERGQAGERYILGGENLSLEVLLERVAAIAGRRFRSFQIPGAAATAVALAMEWVADHVTRRSPAATIEGVRIALRSKALSSEKARRELGYAPRPIEIALLETINEMLASKAPQLSVHSRVSGNPE